MNRLPYSALPVRINLPAATPTPTLSSEPLMIGHMLKMAADRVEKRRRILTHVDSACDRLFNAVVALSGVAAIWLLWEVFGGGNL